MKKIFKYLFFNLFVFLSFTQLSAQNDTSVSRWQVRGYVSSMQSVLFDSISNSWTNDNLLHNRVNIFWSPFDWLQADVQLRTRLMWGDRVKMVPNFAESMQADNGVVDLSWNIVEEPSFLLHTTLDRVSLKATLGSLELQAGRQRINWAQTFVWNPNDIFNTYSFFDFDYPERPGADAIRLTYYTGMSSGVEAALKADSAGNITAAALWRFNRWGYDFQALGGVLASNDFTTGIGWAGNIKALSWRGEMGYFHPTDNAADTSGTFLFSTGFDYMFAQSSLYLQTEILYARLPKTATAGFMEFYAAASTVKNLAFTRWSLFASASYPVNPLLNLSASVMYYPAIKGAFLGPSLAFSLSDNAEASIFVQHFRGEFPNPLGVVQKQQFNLGFLRVKWSF